MKHIIHCLLVVLVFSGTACTEVAPWQRRNLALSQMALTTDELESGLRQHVTYSKEAGADVFSSSSGGGGCGCN